jgi:hypothetical protein
MTFEDFKVLDFPPPQSSLRGRDGGLAYIFCWVADDVETPLYGGQAKRLAGRTNDYYLAQLRHGWHRSRCAAGHFE